MIYLGKFKAGDMVKYRANFHTDLGTIQDPTSPEAQLEKPDDSFTALTTPAKINTKTGHFGGSVDTTGFAVGLYIIRMAGTVDTAKTVATEFSFIIIGNTEAEIYSRLGAPAGASVSADIATRSSHTAANVRTEMDANSTQLTAIAAYVDELETRLTAARAGYLDNLNSGVPLSAAAVDAVLDEIVEGTITLRQLQRILLSRAAGKASGGGTASITFRDQADTKNRIAMTTDSNGNRSAVTVDGA